MKPGLHAALLARAKGVCECGCKKPVPPSEVDHFFGRAKAPETMETCWVLRVACHADKTANRPTAALWLMRFIAHAGRHGYAYAAERAQSKLEWVTAKGVVANG